MKRRPKFAHILIPLPLLTKHNSLEKHLRNKANNLLGLFVHKLNVEPVCLRVCAGHSTQLIIILGAGELLRPHLLLVTDQSEKDFPVHYLQTKWGTKNR